MRGVQCGVCRSVWLSPAARRLIDMSGGCLRCDGPLRLLSEDETIRALEAERGHTGGGPRGSELEGD